jgi:TorA maturation chaperone TorD
MRDPGLSEAIRAAGGVNKLAARIGISQPSVSTWERVPADRVLAVETLTGVARARLRPDLYLDYTAGGVFDEIEFIRAKEYSLLANLLARAPDANFLARLARIRGDASPLGVAHTALAQAADGTKPESIEGEFFYLFIGRSGGELMPYGSHYLTGFPHKRPLVRLRNDLRALGIERSEGQGEPEDHASMLCEIMSGLASGRFGVNSGSDAQIFEKHLSPWLGWFFADLERAKTAQFYRHVGTLGRVFMDIETEAFALPSSKAARRALSRRRRERQ